MVSVVVPVYNVEAYLDKCLESITKQTFSDLEIILLNDGSTDRSETICLAWKEKDERIVYLKKENEGLGATRNKGIQLAKGEYLVFVDSDDWLDLTYVEELYRGITSSNADLCFCDFFTYDEMEHKYIPAISESLIECIESDEEKSQLIMSTPWSMWTRMYRRDLFVNGDLEIPNIIYEDLAVFPTLVFLAHRISYIKKPLYYYRINRSGSIMAKHHQPGDQLRPLKVCIKLAVQHGLFEKHRNSIKKYVLRIAGTTLQEYEKLCCNLEMSKEKEALLQFLDETFPEWNQGISVALFGSFNSRWILQRWLVDIRRVRSHQCFASVISIMSKPANADYKMVHSSPFRLEQVQNDVKKKIAFLDNQLSSKMDYLVLDFLEERWDVLEVGKDSYITVSDPWLEMECGEIAGARVIKCASDEYKSLWKKYCHRLIDKLMEVWKPRQIVLIRMRLSEQYGVYQGQHVFKEIDQIRKINEMLEEFEEYFIQNMKNIYVLDLMKPDVLFTGMGEKYGCFPCYLNGVYYRQAAQQLECLLKARKPVFLLNTHLNNIINAPEQMLKQLETIFAYFKLHQELVLIWRPHPLSLQTIGAMSLRIEQEYRKIIQEFRELENGIYDDSEDIHRAIAISDAYIGDITSSVTTLYKMTGKPLLKLEQLGDFTAYHAIPFTSGIQLGDGIYFSAYYSYALFRLDLLTKKLNYLGSFDDTLNYTDAFLAIAEYKNNLWLIPPRIEDNVKKINLDTLSIESIPLSGETSPDFERDIYCFSRVLQKDHELWILPANYRSIIRLDLQNGRKKIYEIPKEITWEQGKVGFRGGVFVGDKIWMCPICARQILSIDTITGKLEFYSWNYPPNSFSDLTFDGEYLWFAPRQYHSVVGWNPVNGEQMELNQYPAGFNNPEIKFSRILYRDDALWLLPHHANMILKIAINTYEMTGIQGYEDVLGFEGKPLPSKSYLSDFVASKERLFAVSRYANSVVEIDSKTNHLSFYSLKEEEEIINNWIGPQFEASSMSGRSGNQCPVFQERYCSIEYFVNRVKLYLSSGGLTNYTQGNIESQCGKAVWEHIRAIIDV